VSERGNKVRYAIRVFLAAVLVLIIFPIGVQSEPTARLVFHLPPGQLFASFGENCAFELGDGHSCDGIDVHHHRHYANLRADGGGIGSDWLDHDLIKVYALNEGNEWHPQYSEPFAVVAFLGQFDGEAPTVDIYVSNEFQMNRWGPVLVVTGDDLVKRILGDEPIGINAEDHWKKQIILLARQRWPDYGF
jgi:hypothetical protein